MYSWASRSWGVLGWNLNLWGRGLKTLVVPVGQTWAGAGREREGTGTTGLPQRAKQPVTSECHDRSQITDHRKRSQRKRRQKGEECLFLQCRGGSSLSCTATVVRAAGTAGTPSQIRLIATLRRPRRVAARHRGIDLCSWRTSSDARCGKVRLPQDDVKCGERSPGGTTSRTRLDGLPCPVSPTF